uniref:Metalloendopeptidase n=1 Tax=Parastrongyloides trichosuri TaxID=131310 RepID=A0A0N4Z5C0_PARTI
MSNSQCNPLNSSRFILGRNLRKRDVSGNKIILIEYKITSLSEEDKPKFEKVLDEINKNTCFYFNENPNLDGKGKNEVFKGKLFKIKEVEFCNCPEGVHQQAVFEFYNKYYTDIIYQDIGRTIGLPFEHTRIDRNKFIHVMEKNIEIQEDDFKSNCSMDEIINVSYDFGSVMHYSSKKYGHNNKDVIIPTKDYKYYKDTMGQKSGFSFSDYKKINELHCKNFCKKENTCDYGGYLNPNECNKCLCPYPYDPNENCKQFIGKLKKCSKIYTLTEEEKTETVPSEESNNFDCFYEFKTDKNHLIKISINQLSDYKDYQNDICPVGRAVEIRYRKDLSVTGAMFCKQSTEKIISQGNEVLIHYFRQNHKKDDLQIKVERVEK